MDEASRRDLPDEVTEKTKQDILDTGAAMISGTERTPGRAALQFAGAYGGKEVATVVASKIVCGPIEAALTNGILAHARPHTPDVIVMARGSRRSRRHGPASRSRRH